MIEIESEIEPDNMKKFTSYAKWNQLSKIIDWSRRFLIKNDGN